MPERSRGCGGPCRALEEARERRGRRAGRPREGVERLRKEWGGSRSLGRVGEKKVM